MNLSVFVAQLVSFLYLSIAIGMMINGTYYKKLVSRLYEEMTALYLGGFISLSFGFALVTYHNLWVKDWRVLVTIIGWLALIKGITILAFPKSMESMSKSILNLNVAALSGVVLILGLIFGYFGFFVA